MSGIGCILFMYPQVRRAQPVLFAGNEPFVNVDDRHGRLLPRPRRL